MPIIPRYLREDVISGQLSDIELNNVVHERTLNRPGGLTGKVPLRSQYADEQILDPWRTAIYVLHGDNVIGGGILMPPSLDLGGDSLSLTCFGWGGYFDRRIIRGVGLPGTVGQAEPGAVFTAKPIDDASTSGSFAAPVGSTAWQNVSGGYSRLIGVAPTQGHAMGYRSHMSVPITGLTLHPIAYVTVGVVASGVGAPIAAAAAMTIGGTAYQGPAQTLNPGGVYDLSWTMTVNPATGVAWTPADIYAFATSSSAGINTGVATSLVDCVANQIWMVVSYGAGFSDYFANTDQFQIVKQLVDDAQNQTKFELGYDLGIHVIWDALSGVTRNKTGAYTPWLAKNLGDALRDLAAQENGFDYEWIYAIDASTDRITKTIKLHYPMLERDTGFAFEYDTDDTAAPTNVISRGFTDPVQMAWTGDGWGSGNGPTRLTAPYIDATLLGIYPPYDAAPTWSDELSQAELQTKTNAQFQRTNRPRRSHVLRVNPDMDPKWDEFGLGDCIMLRINDGYASVGVNNPAVYRVTGRKVDYDANHYDVTMSDQATLTPGEQT